MLTSLLLPVLLSAIALFFASFLSWMVVQLHKDDWKKMEQEDEFLKAMQDLNVPVGSYMFPGCQSSDEMKSKEYQEKWNTGPCGVMTVYPKVNMGKNLGLTFVFFLVISFSLAYLATLAIPPGAEFMTVFRFMSTAGLLTFLAATIQHAIWFHNRITVHIIESIAYAAIVGTIFGLMWPAA
ncbi:hypothetical protein [Gimesia sp.]|uniref:hypothetical protein n=1 Tax=Gimesia sp. TaxID=2024833 RepID=UPI000C52852E|nr:hypothetical protein [Gimesia sp.]MAX39225.1 hypothetical protein [Gimesia sp.]HAH47944.1 hypothetical protein [Planctomycetaceae bacterium]HBL48447.1 hypothetical protein [Planctomycetaceae bacterium]|tara:strand:+ start:12081 stop:12623 length:543 start_codon:yes stop_codon:yes gene_type:complete